MHRAPLSLLLAVLAALLLSVAGCGGKADQKQSFNGETRFKLPGGTTASLPMYGGDQNGGTQPLRASPGKLMLLFFGFTSCPDVCPTTMSALGAATRSLPQDQRSRIEASMVTVDPARDSGPGIVKYLQHFFQEQTVFGFRTTDKAELAKAEKAFGAHSEIPRHKRGTNYEVEHSAYRYAVDDRGRILIVWPNALTSDEIAEDLPGLLGQLPAPRTTSLNVTDPWIRASAPGQLSGAAYMTIDSRTDDRLVGVTVPKSVAQEAMLHITELDESSQDMTMQEASKLPIPAGKPVKLSPNGTHVMLMGLGSALRAGQKIQLTLEFEDAGKQQVVAQVRR
jgi:cytochrome oxidase Cu insertion factor (SCO1/SenC/PrrC family)/copper(I)-binding protein